MTPVSVRFGGYFSARGKEKQERNDGTTTFKVNHGLDIPMITC